MSYMMWIPNMARR